MGGVVSRVFEGVVGGLSSGVLALSVDARESVPPIAKHISGFGDLVGTAAASVPKLGVSKKQHMGDKNLKEDIICNCDVLMVLV